MGYSIDPRLKRLYSSLLKQEIEEFLITDDFKHICLDYNIDQLWESADSHIKSQSRVAVLVPGYTGYAEDALAIFLEELVKKEDFLEIFDAILKGFSQWSRVPLNFSEIRERLIEIGFPGDDVNSMEIFSIEKKIKEIPEKIGLPSFERKIPSEKEENMCFVLVPFEEKFKSIFLNVIKPAVEKFDLKCLKADDIFGTKPVIQDIWEHIQKSKVMIADLTTRNPNVFYEIGLSHGIGKEVVLITQRIEDIPFDLKHYRCIIYEDSVAGGTKLREGLIKTLEKLLLKSQT